MKKVINILPNSKKVCILIKKAFPKEMCQELIFEYKKNFKVAKTHYPTSYRNNERQFKDDNELSAKLFSVISQYIPKEIEIDGISRNEKGKWKLKGLNSRLRLCRYLPNQYFNKHLDGIFYKTENIQSKLTFMIYLNGFEDFEGGRTLFFNSKTDDTIINSYHPETGDLIIFDHNIWHSGEEVKNGEKYILRSDIFYERSENQTQPEWSNFQEGHLGYIWTIINFNDRIVTSGRDKKIKIWSKEGKKINEVRSHENSVLSLLRLNNNILVSASRDQSIILWKREKELFKQIIKLKYHKANVLHLEKLNGKTFLSSGADGLINIIDKNGNLKGSFYGHNEWIWAIRKIDEERVITISEDGSMKLWNIETKQEISIWTDTIPINSITSDKEEIIFIGRFDGSILKFRIEEEHFELIHKSKIHNGLIRTLKTNEKFVISGGEDNKVIFTDKITLKPVEEYNHKNFVQDILIEDNTIISVSYDGTINRKIIPKYE